MQQALCLYSLTCGWSSHADRDEGVRRSKHELEIVTTIRQALQAMKTGDGLISLPVSQAGHAAIDGLPLIHSETAARNQVIAMQAWQPRGGA